MLEILGTIGANALSFPGILGLAAGMTTRNVGRGALYGGIIGVVETLLFAHGQIGEVEMMELIIGVVVGILAGCVGSIIRRKGAAV